MNWKKICFQILLYLFLFTLPALLYFCTYYASLKDDIYSLDADKLIERVKVAAYYPMNNLADTYYVECKNLAYSVSKDKSDINTLKRLFLKFTLLNDTKMVSEIFKILIATLILFFLLYIYYNKYMKD